jgi:hypothetical protein
MGYGAAAHADSFDPHFTAGFSIDRLPHERSGDNQLFFPELYLHTTQQKGLAKGVIVEQWKGCITLYQGGKLMHTNSITDMTTIDGRAVYAPGIALVQKKGLFGKRRIENQDLQMVPTIWNRFKSYWVFAIGFRSCSNGYEDRRKDEEWAE